MHFFNGTLVNSNTNKIMQKYSINDRYQCDSILVTLTTNESLKFKNYCAKDFFDSRIANVSDLTECITNKIKNNENKGLINNFKRIIKLELIDCNKQDVLDILTVLNNRKDVYIAEPNLIGEYMSIPNDEYIDEQWGITNSNLYYSWDFCRGLNAINVGILDSGIKYDHPDLAMNINTALSEDFTGNNNPWINSNNHGTRIAGIIGAKGNNSIGICGINWNVQLVSLKVGDGNPNVCSVVNAINYAMSNHIPILNMSFVMENTVCLSNAISLYDGLIVCCSGNQSINIDTNNVYPACYPYDNIIVVGAITNENKRWVDFINGSNFGNNSVDIYAPGENILSTVLSNTCDYSHIIFNDGTRLCELPEIIIDDLVFVHEMDDLSWSDIVENIGDYLSASPAELKESIHGSNNNHYSIMGGTSMAAPFVTGVAALLMSISQNLTMQQVKNAILYGADSIVINVGGNNTQNVLKLNAYGAIKYVLQHYSNTTFNLTNTSLTYTDNKYIVSGDSYFVNKNGFYKINVPYAKDYDINIVAAYPFTAILYDNNFNVISYNIASIMNQVLINEYLPVGTYYLKVFFNGNQSGTITTQIIDVHVHYYDNSYTWVNYTRHNAICSCGLTHLERHITNGIPLSPGSPYSQCILCGGLAIISINSPVIVNDDQILNNYSFNSLQNICKGIIVRKKELFI